MQVTCARCSRVLDYAGDRPLFCGFCGQPLPTDGQERTAAYDPITPVSDPAKTAPTADIPLTVGGYRLIRELGSGGMGTVYEAEDAASGRRVAVKLIAADFAASRDTVERFRQEGRLASAIAHPRCVFVLAADEEAGRPYIVMELMPGSTLKDLVEQEGPLPPAQAVALILDIIDGLLEAHQNGVIHRDVKPSNCFLQADGRVKIGDFGLSKSLSNESHLTRTGTFLGTPLFASPEQVRGEAVDHQTDVYSVAATLYYLLTGKAPFQSGDAAITLARLVSDPPPPMRSVRPELPAALDRVVLRGLERQRERRWRTLEALRAALLPFVPSRLSIGGMGIRLAAYVIDWVLLAPLTWIVIFLAFFVTGNFGIANAGTLGLLLQNLGPVVCSVVYYATLEGIWGCSLGKRWLHLRVCRTKGTEPPGLARAFVRALVWNACLSGATVVFSLRYGSAEVAGNPEIANNPLVVSLAPVSILVGIVLVLCTMRTSNGYRGPYEFLSGTRVIQLPWPKNRRVYHSRAFDRSLILPPGLPAQIGPFAVQGAICWNQATQVLLAEDKTLSRKIWLWLRPLSEPPLSPARREVGRSTRLRWLNCGRHEEMQWDAFLAPPGAAVRDLEARAGRLSWVDVRPLLEQLAEELAAAGAEGTLPAPLAVDQVWVQPDGRLHLLDMPVHDSAAPLPCPAEETENRRALALLGEVTVLLLEGHSRPADAAPGPVRAPVPRHVETCLQRLAGVGNPYEDIGQFQTDLAATHDQPAEISRSRRAAHLIILALFMSLGLGFCLMPLIMSPGTQRAEQLSLHISACDRALKQLEVTADTDLLAGLLRPALGAQACAVIQWLADKDLGDRLRQHLAAAKGELEARIQLLSWSGQTVLRMNQAFKNLPAPTADFHILAPFSIRGSRGDYRRLARDLLATDRDPKNQEFPELTMLGIWPTLWVLWALATRGGFSFGMAGIALARTDGRRPSRLRCAWRSLLFWAPPIGLAALSILLDAWFWRDWQPGAGDQSWLPLLSSAAWWTALSVVPIYALLALAFPTRSLHDRLAGTCLVPL